MNLVEMNTASVNNKIAEDYKNGILQDDAWDIKAAEMLASMDEVSAEGGKTRRFPKNSTKWKNQQGVTLKEFLEKKGYTVSQHYVLDHSSFFYYGYGLPRRERIEKKIEMYSNKRYYDCYEFVTSDGSIGKSFEEARDEELNYLHKSLKELGDNNTDIQKDIVERKDTDGDNSQFVIFAIMVLSVLVGVFLMFN